MDFDYVTEQGFWICFIVAVLTFGLSAFAGSILVGSFEGLFFFLAGVGVRQRSRVAALAAFSAYLLSGLVLQRYTGNGFGVARIIALALLLANVRASWMTARWESESEPALLPPGPLQTIGDKISDQLPAFLWPKTRFVFYLLAAVEISLLLLSLVVPARNESN